jgi:hypothetical protein
MSQTEKPMAKAVIHSGRCGFNTIVEAALVDTEDGERVRLNIQSECKSCQRLAGVLSEVDPYREITYRGEGPLTLQLAAKNLPHTACPVPAGIIKSIEVAAGLALPADASITLST